MSTVSASRCRFSAFCKIVVQREALPPQRLKPCLQTENADILCKLSASGALGDVRKPLPVCGLFVLMLISPQADALAGRIAENSRDQRDRQNDRIGRAEQQQINDKADRIGAQLDQSIPDGFRCICIALRGQLRFVAPLDIRGIQKMGVGCCAELVVQLRADVDSQMHLPEQRVLPKIGPPGTGEQHGCRQRGDHSEQRSNRHIALHGVENRRRCNQLQNVDGSARNDHTRRNRENDRCFAVCPADHVAYVLKWTIHWPFHLYPSFCPHSIKKRSPRLIPGTNRFFRGMNCSSHSCGSSISVVNAPSSLLRLMYPSSRSTMASMRTRPKPCPSPLVLRNSPPSFCIFFPAVKLVKEM